MANIGTFKKSGHEFQGEIVTLSLQSKGVRIVPAFHHGVSSTIDKVHDDDADARSKTWCRVVPFPS